MNNKLLIVLSFIAGQAMAMESMELTIDDQLVISADLTEEKVVITIQDQKRELPVRFIPLIGTLAVLYKEGTPLQMSPITCVSLDTWKLIEDQLERVYAITQGEQHAKNEIITAYSQLDNTRFIELIMAVDFLNIALLKEITQQVAENNLTIEELFLLPDLVRNEIIKGKALSLAGPVPAREQSVCSGHEDTVWSVGVSPDGKIVSGSKDKTVRVWDMNGKELEVCYGHEGEVTSVCVTIDDKIVSGSKDKTVRIWDSNGQQLAVCKGHEAEVNSVDVTHDGKIVSGSGESFSILEDNTVRVWDINGKELAVCRGHKGLISSVCVTPDDKIISGSSDKTVRIWNVNGKELAVCGGHKGNIYSICVTPDGKIVFGSSDKTVRVWDMYGEELAVCRGHEDWVHAVCVTPDGKIVSGSKDKTVRVWDINGQQLAVCKGHEGEVNSVDVTHDDKIVSGSGKDFSLAAVSLAADNTVRIWDISLLHRLSTMNNEQAQAVCILLQSSTYASREEQERCWQDIGKIFEEKGLSIKNIEGNHHE